MRILIRIQTPGQLCRFRALANVLLQIICAITPPPKLWIPTGFVLRDIQEDGTKVEIQVSPDDETSM